MYEEGDNHNLLHKNTFDLCRTDVPYSAMNEVAEYFLPLIHIVFL